MYKRHGNIKKINGIETCVQIHFIMCCLKIFSWYSDLTVPFKFFEDEFL